MRYAMTLAVLLAFGGVAQAQPASKRGEVPDLHNRINGTYGEERRREAARLEQRERRARAANRRDDPWGPFVGPPGLFF